MIRRLCAIASALSLLLCIGAAGLWADSYWRAREVAFTSVSSHRYMVQTGSGRFGLSVESPLFAERASPHFDAASDEPNMRDWPGDRLGFGWENLDHPSGMDSTFMLAWCPAWLLVIAFAVPPLWWLARARRRTGPKSGRCAKCGYDLRATPGRCPECGSPIPAEATR